MSPFLATAGSAARAADPAFELHPAAAWRPLPHERRWWLLASGVVVALLLARVPRTRTSIVERVDALVASGALPRTDQQDLAVNLGLVASLLFTALVVFVVLAVARRLQPRLRLPAVDLGRITLPGALVMTAPLLAVKQAGPLLTGTMDPRHDPLVWVALAVTLSTCVGLLVRAAGSRAEVRRVVLTAAAAGLLAVVL